MFAWLKHFSLGVWTILALAVLSSVILLLREPSSKEGSAFWFSARNHQAAYATIIPSWNNTHPHRKIRPVLINDAALERRILSAFMSGTPVADLFELKQSVTARIVSGPEAEIGLRDLTPYLVRDGLIERFNTPSFSPWTVNGKIYGLPHDVHPVLLAYRADLVEAAGIDVAQIETWEDFVRLMRPLQRVGQGSASKDRYLLNIWPTNIQNLEALLLQNGGGMFDAQSQPILNHEKNSLVLTTVALWCVGPNRIALDAPEFSASGNRLKLQGQVLCSILPDWLAGVWKSDLPGMSGKIKLMPLPAWEKGGRRTSVMGGTMLGFPRHGADFEDHWEFAKALYCSPIVAEKIFLKTNIVPPDRTLWPLPVFDRPDPYFSNQPSGRLFLKQAPFVPERSSSPFANQASDEMGRALLRLTEYAKQNQIYEMSALRPEARKLLDQAQAALIKNMSRNVFMKKNHE